MPRVDGAQSPVQRAEDDAAAAREAVPRVLAAVEAAMMTCREFRDQFAPASSDARVLEHVRSCDACLDFAAQIDPDIMFRAIGGAEMVPPGGVDAFVDDVMRQVRVRSAANVVSIQP